MALPMVSPPPMVLPVTETVAVVQADPSVEFTERVMHPPRPEATEKVSVAAEFKMGQPGVYSTVSIRVHVHASYVPGDLADRDAQLDKACDGIHTMLERQSARILEWRAAVGQQVNS